MSINNRLINAGGTAPQPEGTGAMLFTTDTGLHISVDDGASFSQNAFTGIDATDGSKWNTHVKWMNGYFVMRESGTMNIWHSLDGYNWTFLFTPAGSGMTNFAYDQATGYGYFMTRASQNLYTYRTIDNGASFQYIGGHYDVYNYDIVWLAFYNGQGQLTRYSGNGWSNNGGVAWTLRNEDQGSESKIHVQNGVWCTSNLYYYNTGNSNAATTARMSFWTSYSKSTYGLANLGQDSAYSGNGNTTVTTTYRDRYSPFQKQFIYTLNNGSSWNVWKTIDNESPQCFHNSYWFFQDSGSVYKTNNFSSQTLLASISWANINSTASMSILW